MRKSKNITKYNLDWQIIRIKNKKQTVIEQVVNIRTFYNNNKNAQNWERCYNYLEGLYYGYRNDEYRQLVEIAKDWMLQNKTELFTIEVNDNFNNYSSDDLITLYKDLYKRNSKWQSCNYKNSELNVFLRKLHSYLKSVNINLEQNYDVKITQKSTHKFFF